MIRQQLTLLSVVITLYCLVPTYTYQIIRVNSQNGENSNMRPRQTITQWNIRTITRDIKHDNTHDNTHDIKHITTISPYNTHTTTHATALKSTQTPSDPIPDDPNSDPNGDRNNDHEQSHFAVPGKTSALKNAQDHPITPSITEAEYLHTAGECGTNCTW